MMGKASFYFFKLDANLFFPKVVVAFWKYDYTIFHAMFMIKY